MFISKKFSLIKADWKKIWKGFLISLGGLVIAYLSSISGLIDFSHYGNLAPFIAIAVSFVASNLINIIQKWINASTYQVDENDA